MRTCNPGEYEFEFKTSKANKLLHGIPGMTKTKLCEASGITGVGLLNKFLENKSRNCAYDSLSVLIDILEAETEGEVKRRRRLQSLLMLGMREPEKKYSFATELDSQKWSPDKLQRFRKAFPDIEAD